MYTILEHKRIARILKKASPAVRKNYCVWKRIAELEGILGLRLIKGFHDEALKGKWEGFRSSRLNRQWRVIYKADKHDLMIYVIEINPHRY